MKFKRYSKLEHGREQLDIAPLVDVVFQLLIFFMLTSSFTFQSGINVKLPKAVTSEEIKEDNLIITITSEDVIYLGGKIITIKGLREVLGKPESKKMPLLIKSDRRASVGRVVDVWDLCRNSGIERINIATNKD